MRMKKLKLNKKFVRDARNSLIAILNILSVIVLLRGLYILTETVNSEEYNVARPLLLVICGIFILLISNLMIPGKEGRPKCKSRLRRAISFHRGDCCAVCWHDFGKPHVGGER